MHHHHILYYFEYDRKINTKEKTLHTLGPE